MDSYRSFYENIDRKRCYRTAITAHVKNGFELDRINGLELDTRDQVVQRQDGIR